MAATSGQDVSIEDDMEDMYEDIPAKIKPQSQENIQDKTGTEDATEMANDSTNTPAIQLPGIVDSVPQPKESVSVNGNSVGNRTEKLNGDPTIPTDVPQTDGIPSISSLPDQPVDHNAEWEPDSSPYESSSDDSSDTTSSGSDEEYEMLDPAEQARRLMEDEGHSDDDGTSKGAKAGHIKTQNEEIEEPVEVPHISVTPEMAIEELGAVETIVENVALIKANTSGEYRVLEARSLLCRSDRTVIGVVSETLGRVLQPLYSVRFKNAAALEEAGIIKGTTLFYVPQYSTFVFTEALRNLKGSDASNIYDEEAADDEIEFSDDEAEAEYKRNRKAQKQAKRLGRNGKSATDQHPRDGHADPSAITYDDPPEDHYTPLSRPANLHEMMGQSNGSFAGLSRGHRGNRNPRGDRGHSKGRARQNNPRHAPPPSDPSGRAGFSYNPPSTYAPPTHNYNGYNPAMGHGQQNFGYQQPHFSQPTMGYAHYPVQPTYQTAQNPPPFPWAVPANNGSLNNGPPPQHGQPAPPQFPSGVAVNPWFFQNQHPPNGPSR